MKTLNHIISDSFFSNTLSNVCKTLSNNPKDSIQGRYIKNKKVLLLFAIILCNFNLSLTAQTEVTVTGNTNILVNIPDNNSGGVSATVDFSEIPSYANLTGIELSLAINHNNAGDLKIILKSPSNTQMTLVNRPSETFSDGETIYSPANLDDNYPISFSDNAIYSAEIMGGNGTAVFPRLGSNEVICESNNICEFYPDDDGSNNPDTFASFMTSVNNVSGVSGEWEVIIIDSVSGTSGNFLIENIELTYEYDFPVANCQDRTFTLDSNGEVNVNPSDIDNGSTASGSINLSLDQTNFDCSNIGTNTVVLTVTDINGYTDTCQTTITILAPAVSALSCPDDIIAYAPAGGSIVVNYDLSVTGCLTLTQTSGFASGDAIMPGNYINVFEGETLDGTILTCSFNVTVNEVDLSDLGNPFITKWHVVENENGIDDRSIRIPTKGNGYDFVIDWGDGSSLEFHNNGNVLPTHIYDADGDYSIKIYGDFPRIDFREVSWPRQYIYRILEVEQWGDMQWNTMDNAFRNCYNLDVTATDTPDLSNVTTTRFMFHICSNLVGNNSFNNWNLENVEDTSLMFFFAEQFNQPLNNWNVSNVTSMGAMFQGCEDFDQDLSDWDVSKVENMGSLFNETAMDQDLSDWDISSLTSASGMFSSNIAFSTANYDATLIGWATLDPGETQIPTDVSLNTLTKYCASFEEHDLLENVYNWNISDQGIVGPECIKETRVALDNGKLTITDISTDSDDQITLSNDGITLTISNLITPKISGDGVIEIDPTTVALPLASITNGIEFNSANGSNNGFNIITFANDLTLTGVNNGITLTGLKNYEQTGSINIEGDLTINGIGFDLTLGEITANNFTIDGVDRILDQELALTISGVTQLQAGDGVNIENGQGRHSFGGEVILTSNELIFSAGADTTFGEINATDAGIGLPHTFTVAPGDITFNGDVTILGSNANLFVCSLNNISQTGGIIETPFLIFRGNGNTTATIDNNNNNIGALGTSNPFDANGVDLASLSFTNTSNMFLEIIDVVEFNLTAPEFDFEPGFTNITKRGSGVSNFNANIDVNNGTGTAIINHNDGTINFNGDTNDFLSQMTYTGQPGTITNINSVTTTFPLAGTERGFAFGTLNVNDGIIDTNNIDIFVTGGANFSGDTTLLAGSSYVQGFVTTISDSAIISPGGGATGLEYTFDDLIMNTGATFEPLIEGTGVSEFDKLLVNGTLTLDDANLAPNGGFVIEPGDEIIIIDNDDIDPIVGTFNNLPEGSEVVFGDFEGIISYVGGDGNDVVLRSDNVAPNAVCQDITLNIDLTGITVTGDQLDGGSTDNVGITEILIDGETSLDFTIDDIGDNEVTITFVDNNGNTADCMATITLNSTVTLPILISEYQPQIASSLQALEIKGEPGEAFVGTFVVIEGDTDSGTTGIVKSTTSFSTNFNTNGLIVATLPNIEDPTHTVVLTSSFNGTVDVTDIDTDDDGVADDLSSFGVIFDAVGVSDGGACCPEGVRYGTDFGGINLPNIGSVPGAIFREGSDGDFYQISFSTGDLYDNTATIVDASSFNTTPTLAGTFGSINPIRLSVDCDNHTTWDGTSWNNGTPDATYLAIINGAYDTTTDGNIVACELIINDSFALTIRDNEYVDIVNNITIEGTLTVTNMGSVVQRSDDAIVTNNGSISIAKITPTLDDRNFVAMSSPVTSENRDRAYGNSRAVFSIIPSNFVPFDIDLMVFPEFAGAENFLDDNNDYLLPVTGSTALPNAGIGQLVFPQPAPNVGDGAYTITYTQNPSNPGTLNSGTISVPINYNGPATINNYNLLGNPYASAIDVEAFINANDAVNEVYYWDHLTNPTSDLPGFGTSNFSMNDISMRNTMMGVAAVNGGTAPGQFMASGQGFGIKADQTEMMDNTPVVFTNSIRVAGNNDGFRNAENNDIDRIWLNLTTEAYEEATSQTGIGFTPNATPGFDPGYDSPRLGTFISLFTTLETGEQLSIQGREAFDTEIEITLGFATSVETQESYAISIDHLEGINIENATVYLIDNLTNTTTNLNEGRYSFTATSGIQPERFTVIFQKRDVLNTDEFSFRESVTLYPNPATHQVTLGYVGQAQLQKLTIIDMNGKVIRTVSLENFQNAQVINTSQLAKGMYFLNIQSNKDTIVQKLIIK